MATFTERLEALRVEWRRGSKAGEVNICCPFCPDRGESLDTRFRLGINVAMDKCHCFNCGYSSRSQAVKWILRKLGSEEFTVAQDTAPVIEKPPAPELPSDFEYLWKIDVHDITDPLRAAAAYWLSRGFTMRQARLYRVGASMLGRYAYRLIMPVLWRSKLRGIVARDFTGTAKAKYLNSKGEKYLWNADEITEGAHIVLVEGCFKGIAVEAAIKEDKVRASAVVRAAAVLGHSLTNKQLKQLQALHPKVVTIWPDPDKPGIKGAVDMASKVAVAGFRTQLIWPAPRKQADELDRRAILRHLNAAKKFDWGLCETIRAKLSFED